MFGFTKALRPVTVENALSAFRRALADLDHVKAFNDSRADYHRRAVEDAQQKLVAHETEAQSAAAIAEKLRALISV